MVAETPAAVDYEPVEWNTGSNTFTNITEQAKSEEVRLAAVEHRQRVEKPRSEKVEYKNWDFSKKSIKERFVLETYDMVELAQQVVENLRVPKDPRGFGWRG